MATASPIDRSRRRRFDDRELRALIDAKFFGPDERPVLDDGAIVDARTGAPRRFTVADLDRLDDLHLLEDDDDDRFELIDGEILIMARAKPRHYSIIAALNKKLSRRLGDRAEIRIQSPVDLGPEDEPQPDLALVARRDDDYRYAHPAVAETFLMIEVMDSTVWHDRVRKLPRYAAAGALEVWLVDLPGDTVEVCRQPQGDQYVHRVIHRRGESLAPAAFPDIALTVDEILG